MFKYNVQIQKVSGSLNESSMPTKNLVVKSKTQKTDKQVFAEASNYYKEKYGLVIESADVYRNRASQKSMAIRILTRPMVIREDGLRTLKPLMYQPFAEQLQGCIKKGLFDKVVERIQHFASLRNAKIDKDTNAVILTIDIVEDAVSSVWNEHL